MGPSRDEELRGPDLRIAGTSGSLHASASIFIWLCTRGVQYTGLFDGELSRAEAAMELSVKSPGSSCPGGVSLVCKCCSLSTELELVRMVIRLGAQVERVHREVLCCELGRFSAHTDKYARS